MKVEAKAEKGTQVKDIAYGELCTFPRYGHNMVCMRVKTHQKLVSIMIGPDQGFGKSYSKVLDMATGVFYLVPPWEACKPFKGKLVADI